MDKTMYPAQHVMLESVVLSLIIEFLHNVLDQHVAQVGMWPTPPKRVRTLSSHQP
jgi:hypothetical protein